jgi:hypothetical protein
MNTNIMVGCVITVSSACGILIWYYLLYNVLVFVQATELMWFLYWVYVPVGLVAQILSQLFLSMNQDKE